MFDQALDKLPFLRKEVQRGADAQALLDNPLMLEAIQAYEDEITNLWKTSPLRDVEGREKLRLMLEASSKFRAYMVTTVETGKLATAQIKTATQQPGLLRRAFG